MPMVAAARSASPSRHALALLVLLAALPPGLRADDCVSDPLEGIFCSGDDGMDYEVIYVSGSQSAAWTADTLVANRTYYYVLDPGSTLEVTGSASDYYQAKVFTSGYGAFHLVGGYLRALSFGNFNGDFYLTDSHFAGTLYGPLGGNWPNSSVFHVTNATLRLERSEIYDANNTFANPLVLSGFARIDTVASGFYNPADINVVASNVVSGDGTLVKTGAGLLRLQATNTYSGGTRIEGGNLEVSTDANLGAAESPVAFGSGGGLWLNEGFSSARATTLEGGLAYVGVRSGSATWNGVVSGDGALVKTGPGTLTLATPNTYGGGTTVSAGTLEISTDANLGAADSPVSLGDDATLSVTAGFASSTRPLALTGATGKLNVPTALRTLTWNGPSSGAGKLVKQGAGTLVLAGGTGHTGGALLETGTLEVSVSSTLGGTGSTTWTGPISGTGALVKSGAGTLVLTGAATHTGYTTVRGGTLKTGAANALSADSALFLIGGSTLDLDGHDQTVGDLDSYNATTGKNEFATIKLGGATLTNLNRVTNNWAGAITGNGTVIKRGAATMNWYAQNTFTGTLQIEAGTVSTQALGVLSPHAAVVIASGASLNLNGGAQTIAGLSGSGGVQLGSGMLITNQAGDSTFAGAFSGTGSLVKSGAGILSLAGTNSLGNLTVNAGAVRVAADAALGSANGTVTLDGGALATTTSFTSDRAVSLGASGGMFDTTATTTLTWNGKLSGAGGLNKRGAGTLTLSGDNAYSGGTTVQAGTLRAAHVNAFGSGSVEISGGTVDFNGFAIANSIVNRGGALTGLANYAGEQTIAGSVSFSGTVGGSVVVADTAALDTTGAAFTGPVTVRNGGTLSGTGTLGTVTIAAGGTLSPGNSPGLLTLGDGSILEGTTLIELGGLVRGDDHDAIDVLGPVGGLGSVTVGGTLQIVFWNGWTPSGEASFQIFRASSIGGTFAQIDLPALAAGYEWNHSRLLSDGVLEVVASAVPEPASAAALASLILLGFTATRRRRGR